MMNNDNASKPHQGRNIKRIRELRGMKQDALAVALAEITGEKWDQSKISYLEQKEIIETQLLEEVAKILHVPVDAIQTLSESQLPMAIFSPTFHDNSGAGWFSNFTTINLNGKVIELFERLLLSEQSKTEMLKQQIESLTRAIDALQKNIK